MTFLNPWLLLGAVAIGAPLWLHLRRRDREKIIQFAALRFLDDQPVATKAPWQLRDILLFLLRLLAVLLFVAAFAQPFLQRGQSIVPSSHVYIIDNSLSRQVDQGLEKDRDFVLKEIRGAGPREQIAVVELGIQPRVVVNFGDSPADAEARLKAMGPTFQRGALVAALRQANLLLKQSLGEQKEITVLTDHQENQWSENLNSPPFLAAGTVTTSALPIVADRVNYAINDPKILRVYLGESSMVQCSAQLSYTGKIGQAEVVWNVNGKELSRDAVKLDPKSNKLILLGKWEADPSRWLTGSIRVEGVGDSLPQDNAAYFSYPPVMEGKVALLSESVYLKSALSGAVAQGKWDTRILAPSALAQVLAASPAQDADILVIDGNYLQSTEARRLVQRYLEGGKGVFMLLGKSSTLLTGFLQELGFEPRRFSADETEPFKPIRYFASESAIFRPFMTPDFGNLLEVRVGGALVLGSKLAKPVLFSQEGNGLLFEGSKGPGRFLLSTFSLDRHQTDWGTHPTFVPFLDLALQFLRPPSVLNAAVEPGEIWQAQIPLDRDIQTVVLHGEGGEISRQPVPPGKRVSVRAPDQPGLYSLSYDDRPEIEQMLAVNVSPRESELRYLKADPDALKAWTLSSSPEARADHSSAAALLPAEIEARGQDWWWKLLLAGLGCLFLEMLFLAKRPEVAA